MTTDVCVGGSFNIIHAGHRALLATAVKEADGGIVFVGLASDRLASKGYETPSIQERANRVAKLLGELGCPFYYITPIDSPYPPGLTGEKKDPATENITVIVVSEETEPSAHTLNTRRKRNGLAPLKIVEVPMVAAYDKEPIHARRIAAGEIDENGKDAR